MGEKALFEAVREGIPLVEFTILFVDGTDSIETTERMNAIAEDFHINEKPYYDDPMFRIASATKEALERMFDWKLKRVRISPEVEAFRWEEVSSPNLTSEIVAMGLSQPGADDEGQWYE